MKNDRIPLEEALNFMKGKVNEHIKIINRNSDTIKTIISREPPSPNREEKLKVLYAENKALFKENNALLELQKKIVDYKAEFLIPAKNKKYYDKAEDTIVEEITYEECYYRTLDGSLKLDDEHPMIDNEEFLTQILEYYMQHEHYEKCAEVSRLIDQLANKNQGQCQTR